MANKPVHTPLVAPFAGFGPGALPFLEGLAANQTREWFQANKAVYDAQLREPLGALVEALAFAFAAQDIPLTGDARRSLFRIHRDVRFAKDKSPYKTNAGAVMTRDGTKESNGLLYIQVGGNEGSFMGVGFYGLEPKDLSVIRHAMVDTPRGWQDVVETLTAAGLDFSMGAPLARLPKGFEDHAGSPLAEMLKRRNFIVRRPIPAARLAEVGLVDQIVEFTASALPLLRFGWTALDRARGADLAA